MDTRPLNFMNPSTSLTALASPAQWWLFTSHSKKPNPPSVQLVHHSPPTRAPYRPHLLLSNQLRTDRSMPSTPQPQLHATSSACCSKRIHCRSRRAIIGSHLIASPYLAQTLEVGLYFSDSHQNKADNAFGVAFTEMKF